ncbi:MAG: hypothetical protein L0Y44_06020 [Phycisphaerales bacterium]|nr:hypothetical protein [Phycisphaerales bacterium]MCI0630196.1 hypothetical protein [Phycisphaerales bacterium]MCI0677206.1 hypothetical protein [Phycisphaerales bacterium]
MSLSVGKSKLVGSYKDLMVRWEKTKAIWDDPMSLDIERTLLEPMEPKIRAAVSAMEKMGEMLARARRECE